MKRFLFHSIATLALAFAPVLGQQMQKAEEPDEVGLTKVWPELSAERENSLPFNDRDFRSSNALITADGLSGGIPYAFTITVRSTAPVVGRASFETEAVYYGKHVPLQLPGTGGEWKRVSFYFRTAPETTSATIRFNAAPEGQETEFKEPHLRKATEEAFTAAWKSWRSGYPERDLSARPDDGANLERFIDMLQNPKPGVDELLVYGIGSSYTNMLGNGERLIQWVREHFPNAPKIVYKKHVGSAVAYDFTRGWMRQLVLGEQPDLVILYSEGFAEDLEPLLRDFRSHCAADVIVASLHLRERAGENTPETVDTEKWRAIRDVAEKYRCEWVDNRIEHAAYLTKHGQPIEWLLKDAVHQSDHGALVINESIVRHIQPREVESRPLSATLPDPVEGYRVDLYGERSPSGKTSRVTYNGKPASEFPAFVTTLIRTGQKNHRAGRGSAADNSPHMIRLGSLDSIVPQQWTLEMTSDTGDYRLTGSVTGNDGEGNNGADYTSNSGQITVPTDLWRRRLTGDGSHANRKGDYYTWEVKRSAIGEVDFSGPEGEPFRVTLVTQIPENSVKIVVEPPAKDEGKIIGYDIIQPAVAE